MKTAFAGFDLMVPAMEALCENTEVIKLFTCRVDGDFETNDRVIALARRYDIPVTDDRITPAAVEELIKDGCELLLSAGYYYRIPVDDRLPMVNIHPSLLPYGRGAWPMPLAILDGICESGVTFHKTEERFDTGDILLQERFVIDENENLETFMDKVNARIPGMVRALTADLERLWREAQPQGEGCYQEEPRPEDYVLTRHSSIGFADRVLRAFWGYYTVYADADQVFRIRKGRVVNKDTDDKSFVIDGGSIEIIQE